MGGGSGAWRWERWGRYGEKFRGGCDDNIEISADGAGPPPPLARCASIYTDLGTAIDSKSTVQPLKQWLCGFDAPTVPTIDADLRGADCEGCQVWTACLDRMA